MKRTLFIIISLVSNFLIAHGQEMSLHDLDNHAFIKWLRTYRSQSPGINSFTYQETEKEKCGLAITGEIIRRRNSLSPIEREELGKLLAPLASDTTIISPSKHFIIHFSQSGFDSTTLVYAQEAAKFFDHVWEIEVDSLGYTTPPFQTGTNAYHVYIRALSGGLYGQTIPDQIIPSSTTAPCYTSYIEVDNDFLKYYSSGLNGLKVTAAHEFHHAIQIGTYGYFSEDRYMYELTSTYFEDYVYTDVNDYYQYLPSLFQNPERSMYKRSGYDLVVWGKILEQRHSPRMLRSGWEQIRTYEPLIAFDQALKTDQSNFGVEYCAFSLWNYFTSYRTKVGDAYPEARNYPAVSFMQGKELLNGSMVFSDQLTPLATHYLRCYKGVDTVSFIIANINFTDAALRKLTQASYQLEVRQSNFDQTFTPLSNNWGYKFTVQGQNVFCVQVLVSDVPSGGPVVDAYPNPFNPGTDNFITFTLPPTVSYNKINLSIFSTTLDLFFQEEVPVKREGGVVKVLWDGKTKDNTFVGSGVFFYTLTYGDEVKIGKFAVLNR